MNSVKTIKEEGRLVADNERYTLYDYRLDELTVSLTELKKGQETRGHSHESNAEVYTFLKGGHGAIIIGNDRFEADGSTFFIPRGVFHKVVNESGETELRFIAVFMGDRKESAAVYARDSKESFRAPGARLNPPTVAATA
jgi:oxalate decarboxylase/phosphoglucose isomerase-like protein (cupin superfamily)